MPDYNASKSNYYKDISGKRFGRLVVLEPTEERNQNNVVWKCICDCGNVCSANTASLNRGHTKSCGCLHIETARKTGQITGGKSMPYGVASFRDVIRIYKRNAKTRDLQFELTNDEIAVLTKGDCYYCGSKPSKIHHPKRNNGPYIYNGIDRVNNDKGYILDNCVPCCTKCNKMKERMSANTFLEQIGKVNTHLLTWEVT